MSEPKPKLTEDFQEMIREVVRDEFRRLYPAQPVTVAPFVPHGCVCPAGAEMTCGSAGCPRRGFSHVITYTTAAAHDRA